MTRANKTMSFCFNMPLGVCLYSCFNNYLISSKKFNNLTISIWEL